MYHIDPQDDNNVYFWVFLAILCIFLAVTTSEARDFEQSKPDSFTPADETKLDAVEPGAEQNVDLKPEHMEDGFFWFHDWEAWTDNDGGGITTETPMGLKMNSTDSFGVIARYSLVDDTVQAMDFTKDAQLKLNVYYGAAWAGSAATNDWARITIGDVAGGDCAGVVFYDNKINLIVSKNSWGSYTIGTTDISGSLTTGSWHEVILDWDADTTPNPTLTVYVDGTEVDTLSDSNHPVSTWEDTIIDLYNEGVPNTTARVLYVSKPYFWMER